MNQNELDTGCVFCNFVGRKTFNHNLMRKILFLMVAAAFAVCSCNKPGPEPEPEPQPELIPIKLSTDISTKATDSQYENGYMIGVYVVNNVDGEAGALANSGNHLDNTKFTFNGTEWKADKEVYWEDQTTPADFYCYYPYTASVSDVTALTFSVKENQSSIADYKASDLLYGKTTGAQPSEEPVKITTKHALSNIIVYVTPGKGYTEETLAAEDITVTVTGVKTTAKLNLATGAVSADGNLKDIVPYKENSYWRALVVPQDIIGTEIIKVTVGSDVYTLNQTVTFEPNKQHKCTLKINRIGEGVNISIGGWESADTDFGGTLE